MSILSQPKTARTWRVQSGNSKQVTICVALYDGYNDKEKDDMVDRFELSGHHIERWSLQAKQICYQLFSSSAKTSQANYKDIRHSLIE